MTEHGHETQISVQSLATDGHEPTLEKVTNSTTAKSEKASEQEESGEQEQRTWQGEIASDESASDPAPAIREEGPSAETGGSSQDAAQAEETQELESGANAAPLEPDVAPTYAEQHSQNASEEVPLEQHSAPGGDEQQIARAARESIEEPASGHDADGGVDEIGQETETQLKALSRSDQQHTSAEQEGEEQPPQEAPQETTRAEEKELAEDIALEEQKDTSEQARQATQAEREEVEQDEVAVSEEHAPRLLEDSNANLEMPAIAKVPGAAGEDPAHTRAERTEPPQAADAEGEGSMPVPPGSADQGTQGARNATDEVAGVVPAARRNLAQDVQKVQKNTEDLDDPPRVQKVMDSSAAWYEDSLPLRANYSNTTAYRVAIRKEQHRTVGEIIFLVACGFVLVGIFIGVVVNLPRLAAAFQTRSVASTPTLPIPTTANKGGTPIRHAGAETAAPRASGTILTSYQWIHDSSKHILYIDAGNHIQELSTGDQQNWQITDITQRSGAALPNGRTLAGFEWQRGGSEQIVYVDAKGHVQQLHASSNGQWDVMDLTRKAQAPNANGNAIIGYEWSANGSKQVVYIDQNNHIQELASSDGNNWRATDLTALTKAPPANGGMLVGYEWSRAGGKEIVYIDTDQHIQELNSTGNSWRVTDLTIVAGAPPTNGKTLVGYEWHQTGARQIAYVDTNNHIRLLSSTRINNWSLIDLTQLVKAPNANGNTLVGFEWQQGGRNVLYFIDQGNHIQEISDAPGEDWQLADLSQFVQTAPLPNGRVLVGYDWAQRGSKQITYIDGNNVVQELTSTNQPNKWTLSSWKRS